MSLSRAVSAAQLLISGGVVVRCRTIGAPSAFRRERWMLTGRAFASAWSTGRFAPRLLAVDSMWPHSFRPQDSTNLREAERVAGLSAQGFPQRPLCPSFPETHPLLVRPDPHQVHQLQTH